MTTLRRRRSDNDTMPRLIHTPPPSSSGSTPLSSSFNNKNDKYSKNNYHQRRSISNNSTNNMTVGTTSRLLTRTTTTSSGEDADSLSSDLSYNSAASGTPLLLDAQHYEESSRHRTTRPAVPPGMAPPSTPHQQYYEDCLQPLPSYVPPPQAPPSVPILPSSLDPRFDATSGIHPKIAAENVDGSTTRQRSRSLLDFSNFSSGLSSMMAGATSSGNTSEQHYHPAFGPTTRRSQSTGTLLHERKQHHTDSENEDDDVDSVSSDLSVEEKILNVVDQVEDEWDELAYDRAVPLEIKLALEHNVFGWTHLTSDILGHLVFMLGAFALVHLVLLYVMPLPWTVPTWVRWVLSVVAAASSFRMVRRRRRIWLRAPYGSVSYLQHEAERRKAIAQVDQMSWLARMRLRSKQKKVERKLAKADNKFWKQEQRRLKERIQLSSPTNNEDSYQNHAVANPEETMTTPLTRSPELTTPSPSRKRRLSFSTDPVRTMESVQHDQIVFNSGLIQRVPYLHGGGFGAAPFMLANPHWISVLRHLMPDVYVEISRRVQAPPQNLIHWAENNPIIAAYTTAHSLEYHGTSPNIEWDVFLDPHLVNRVLVVLAERRTFLLSVLPELPTVKPMETLPEFESQLTTKQRNIVKFYERELRKRVQVLVDEMMIAHGNLAQLSLEQTGYLKQYNYSRVKRTRRTLGGGMFARQWMAVYAESLRVGMLDESPSSQQSRSPHTTSLVDMATSSCPNTSIAASVAIIKHVVKREEPFGLILDVKSRHVPAEVWACVVDCLGESGVRVEGVGHFITEEIRTLRQYTVRPVRELILFHSAGDLQQSCHDKKIRYGDTVFFNAGCLLWTPACERSGWTGYCQQLFEHFDPEVTKQSYRIQPFALPSRMGEEHSYNNSMLTSGWTGSTIEDYKKRYNLSIGLYLQEFAVDETAVNLLVQLVNDHPEIYDLGLAWGGVNGVTLQGIQPGPFTDTSGFWNQRYVGAEWNSTRGPPV